MTIERFILQATLSVGKRLLPKALSVTENLAARATSAAEQGWSTTHNTVLKCLEDGGWLQPAERKAWLQTSPLQPGRIRLFRGEPSPAISNDVVRQKFGLVAATKALDWDMPELEGIGGRWRATSIAYAKYYWDEHGGYLHPGLGQITYLDVPSNVVRQSLKDPAMARWSRAPGEVFLPAEYRDLQGTVVPYRLHRDIEFRHERGTFIPVRYMLALFKYGGRLPKVDLQTIMQ